MQTVKQGWQSYLSEVIKPDASYTQKTETQKAYYAGAAIVLNITMEMADEKYSEVEAIKLIDDARQEVTKFFKAFE